MWLWVYRRFYFPHSSVSSFNIQVVEPDNLRQQADMRTLRTITYENQRGLILDRHGEVLAASVPLHAIWVDPKKILEQEGLG